MTLPSSEELRSMSLESVPSLFRNMVEYCKAQTLQIRSLEKALQQQKSETEQLKESVTVASSKSDDVHATSRALGSKVSNVEQEIQRVSNVVRGSVTEAIEAHLAGLQTEIQSTRKNASDRLARMEDAFSADGIFLREVRSTARDVAAEAVNAAATSLRRETAATSSSLTERIDALNEDVRRHGATATEASAFVTSHRDSILGAAAAHEHLNALKQRNAEIVDLRSRIDTAESASIAATSAVDSLRNDFTTRLATAGREASEARHLAEACVSKEVLAEEIMVQDDRRKAVYNELTRGVSLAQDAAERLASRLVTVEAQVQDVATAQGAMSDATGPIEARIATLEGEFNVAGVSSMPGRMESLSSQFTSLSTRLERVEGATANQDYGVLQSALAHTRSRVEEVSEIVNALPGGADIEARAIEIAEAVATKEVAAKVADCVAEEMVRVTGAAQRSAEAAVEDAMVGAVAQLKEAAEPRDLREVVDTTVTALEKTSSAWRSLATDVELLQKRSETAQNEAHELAVALGGVRSNIGALDERFHHLAGRVGATSEEVTVMELLDGLRHSLGNVEMHMNSMRDVVRLQASGTGLPSVGRGGRARSPSPAVSKRGSRGAARRSVGAEIPGLDAAGAPSWPRPRGSVMGNDAASFGVAAHGLTPGRGTSFSKRDDALRFSRGVVGGMPGEV